MDSDLKDDFSKILRKIIISRLGVADANAFGLNLTRILTVSHLNVLILPGS